MLHAHRGQHAGTSLITLCALARRTPVAALAQVAAAQRYLARMRSPWRLLAEDRETEDGAQERYFWLVAPHCPRPPARQVPEWHEPEFITFEDFEAEFPILPRWE